MDMDNQNAAKEKRKLEEEFNTQIEAIRAVSGGSSEQNGLTTGPSGSSGFGEVEDSELQEQVWELEARLRETDKELQSTIATKELLMERLADLDGDLPDHLLAL